MRIARALLSFLAAVFVYIFYAVGSAFAQALPVAAPASGGLDWGLIILVLAIAIVGGFFLLKRKDPELATKLTDLLHKKEETHAALVATNATLANVVASAPVQAVVNSTPQNAPGATLAMTQVPRDVPPGAAPGGTWASHPGEVWPGEPGYPTTGRYAGSGIAMPIPGYSSGGNPNWTPSGPADKSDELGAAIWHMTMGRHPVPAGKETTYNNIAWGFNPAEQIIAALKAGNSAKTVFDNGVNGKRGFDGYTFEDVLNIESAARAEGLV